MLGRRLGFAVAALAAFAACAAPGDEEVEQSEDEVTWEPISRALGNPPNFAQLGNGSTTSSYAAVPVSDIP